MGGMAQAAGREAGPQHWLEAGDTADNTEGYTSLKGVMLALGDNREFMHQDDWIKAGTVRHDSSR